MGKSCNYTECQVSCFHISSLSVLRNVLKPTSCVNYTNINFNFTVDKRLYQQLDEREKILILPNSIIIIVLFYLHIINIHLCGHTSQPETIGLNQPRIISKSGREKKKKNSKCQSFAIKSVTSRTITLLLRKSLFYVCLLITKQNPLRHNISI